MALEKECLPLRVEKFLPDEEKRVEKGLQFNTLDESFPSKERIKKRKDFKELFKNGKKRKGKNLILFYLPGENRRIGFILAHKIKGSVIRNKLKRRLREIYRKNKSNFKGDYIILAYPGAERMDYQVLQKEILKLI